MVMDEAGRVLKQIFGYDDFRGTQREVIEALVGGMDALTLMPTGGGKSLCYQIPALIRSGTGIVVSPLIALMQDQVDALLQLGVRAAFLNSSQTSAQQSKVKDLLLKGDLDLLYVAPERLLSHSMIELMNATDLALFAIDEAHCVSQWGHDFRPEYQQLSQLADYFPHVPRIALTATADEKTRAEIIEQLRLEGAKQYVSSFDRPNICYTINEGGQAKEQLWRFLENDHAQDAGIIYCLSRKKTQEIADWLCAKGRSALAYHAGLEQEVRRERQARFLREDGLIMVATIAFGMGIDKPDVRFVAHLNLPKSIEAYYQETGRAGRDGEPANSWMAYGLNDVITYQQWIDQSTASDQQKKVERQKLDALLGLFEASGCRRQRLLSYFGETLEHGCGNCDNCLSPPETMDGKEAAQKALSTVYRTGQRFGVSYLIKVLLGKEDERILANAHDQISTFGIGVEFSDKEWRGVFRQLIAQGFLISDTEVYGGLKMSNTCRPLLKGDMAFELRRLRKQPRSDKKRRDVSSTIAVGNMPLWEALVAARIELALEQKVPPYVICHNKTLYELVAKRPASMSDLYDISGLAERKIARYGQKFLDVIAQTPLIPLLDNKLSDTVNQSLYLLHQGHKPSEIAQTRNLQLGTIHGHLAEAIEAGVIDLDVLDELDETAVEEIGSALEKQNALETGQLKPCFEALEGRYNYGLLKCVLADRMLNA